MADSAGRAAPGPGPAARGRPGGTALSWSTRSPPAESGPYVQLTFGEDFDCALRGDGVAHCWGNHRFGQFKVSAGIHFTEIAAGNYHVCGLTTESQVVCWGGEAEAFKRIGFLDIPSDVQFTKLGALRYQTCGRTVGGEIICWGRGRFSEEHWPSPLDDKLYSYNIPRCDHHSARFVQPERHRARRVLRSRA